MAQRCIVCFAVTLGVVPYYRCAPAELDQPEAPQFELDVNSAK
jgi:hypothetical protein